METEKALQIENPAKITLENFHPNTQIKEKNFAN